MIIQLNHPLFQHLRSNLNLIEQFIQLFTSHHFLKRFIRHPNLFIRAELTHDNLKHITDSVLRIRVCIKHSHHRLLKSFIKIPQRMHWLNNLIPHPANPPLWRILKRLLTHLAHLLPTLSKRILLPAVKHRRRFNIQKPLRLGGFPLSLAIRPTNRIKQLLRFLRPLIILPTQFQPSHRTFGQILQMLNQPFRKLSNRLGQHSKRLFWSLSFHRSKTIHAHHISQPLLWIRIIQHITDTIHLCQVFV